MDLNKKLYCNRMGEYAVMQDKIFFLNYLTPTTLIDFGCADAAILLALRAVGWKGQYIGYDYDPEMIENAKHTYQEDGSACFSSSFEDIIHYSDRRPFNGQALLFSSVLHEFPDQEKVHIKETLKLIFDVLNLQTVIIRDMGLFESQRIHNERDIYRLINAIKSNYPQEWNRFLHDYVVKRKYNYEDILKFLLTYRYTENWEKECKEKYLSLSINEVASAMAYCGFKMTYFHHFVHEFIAKKLKEDFALFRFDEPTHYKGIWTIR